MAQVDIDRLWEDLLKRYEIKLPGFGGLIRRDQQPKFKSEVENFEIVLKAWVEGFRQLAANEEETLLDQIITLIRMRAAGRQEIDDQFINKSVRDGIQRLRVIDPCVKLVFKEISWESTRDTEFTQALHKALPEKELKGWFEVFMAARQV